MPQPTNPAEAAVSLLFWHFRHQLQTPAVQITAQERTAMQDSLKYNGQAPIVRVTARKRNAQGQLELTEDDVGSGAVMIELLDRTSGDQIIFTESDPAEQAKADRAVRRRRLCETAPSLAQELRHMLARGDLSEGLVAEACEALEELARS
jgi:hypothetical protein